MSKIFKEWMIIEPFDFSTGHYAYLHYTHLKKIGGTKGSYEVCPNGSFVFVEVDCKMEKTEKGIPEQVCRVDLFDLFS